MPSIKEKIAIEQRNGCNIYLWPEGTFYAAYERSAYLFVNYVRPYQVRHKFYKVVLQEVIDIGFPKSVLDNLGHSYEVQLNGCVLLSTDGSVDEQSYQSWREVVINGQSALSVVSNPEHAVAERIRRVNMAEMTPMQCMLLLSELQKELI